jgi:hypothetical protein
MIKNDEELEAEYMWLADAEAEIKECIREKIYWERLAAAHRAAIAEYEEFK